MLGLLLGLGVALLGAGTLAAQTVTWAPGPLAAGDNSFVGFIDQPANGASVSAGAPLLVSGWVVDRNAEGWAGIDDVHVYVGKAGQGGSMLGKAFFAQSRPDVAAYLNNHFWQSSGFGFVIPAGSLQPGVQTLAIYAHTPGKGWWYQEVTVNVTAAALPQAAPATAATTSTTTSSATTTTASNLRYPNDPLVQVIAPVVDSQITTDDAEYLVKGVALDRNAAPDQGSGVDRVEIWLDGERGNGKELGKAKLRETYGTAGDYGAQFNNSGFGLEIKPTTFHEGDHTFYIYVRSSVTGREVLVKHHFQVAEREEDDDDDDDDE